MQGPERVGLDGVERVGLEFVERGVLLRRHCAGIMHVAAEQQLGLAVHRHPALREADGVRAAADFGKRRDCRGGGGCMVGCEQAEDHNPVGHYSARERLPCAALMAARDRAAHY